MTCRNRHDGLSFACGLCKKTFPTKRHLNEHCKRKHGSNAAQKATSPETNGHFSPSPACSSQTGFQVQVQEQSLPAFQHQYPPYSRNLPTCDFANEALENHLLGHLPQPTTTTTTSSASTTATPTSSESQVVVTGNDLPLPQICESGEENVGSLMRLVYGCTSDNQNASTNEMHFYSSNSPQVATTQHQQQQHEIHHQQQQQQQRVIATQQHIHQEPPSLIDYPILEGLPIDCL